MREQQGGAGPHSLGIIPFWRLSFNPVGRNGMRGVPIKPNTVIPAQAGIHNCAPDWIPAFAGMTTYFYSQPARLKRK